MDGDERTDGPEKPPVEASTSDGAPPQDGRPTAGRPEQLTDAQMRELAEIVETNDGDCEM